MNRHLRTLWDWAYEHGQDAALNPSDIVALHGSAPTPENRDELPFSLDIQRRGIQKSASGMIVGRPFTRRFERYLDGQKPMTPIRRALLELKPRKKEPWTLEIRILWAVVENGYAFPEDVRTMLRCSESVFEEAAMRALVHLQRKTELLERAA